MRRRYIYDPIGKVMVDVTDEKPLGHRAELRDYQKLLWNDRHYHNTRALDGTDIGTRKKHNEYMKRNGLAMVSDFNQHWKTAEKKRAAVFAGKDPSRREDVARAFYQVENKRGRR